VLEAAAKADVTLTDTAAATSSARIIEVMDGSPEMKSRSALRIGLAVRDQGAAADSLKKV
jgi:bacterioferritin (cytochrome b1)